MIKSSSILIIGVGGLGCASLPYLAASGIRKIGIIDFDKIETSNLGRQTLFGHSDIGQWKVDVAKKRLSGLHPEVHFDTDKSRLCTQNALELFNNYDLIVDGTDNIQTRLVINDTCSTLNKPWIYGSLYQLQGHVSLFLPGFPDYRTLFPEGTRDSPIYDCSSESIIGPFVGLIGMTQALIAIKWLSGIEEDLAGKLHIIDGKTWRHMVVNLIPALTEYNDKVSKTQLKKWMKTEPVQLIDIRTNYESFSKKQKIVLYCQTGQRSLRLARQLRTEGYDAYSLEGGANALNND